MRKQEQNQKNKMSTKPKRNEEKRKYSNGNNLCFHSVFPHIAPKNYQHNFPLGPLFFCLILFLFGASSHCGVVFMGKSYMRFYKFILIFFLFLFHFFPLPSLFPFRKCLSFSPWAFIELQNIKRTSWKKMFMDLKFVLNVKWGKC